MDRSRRGSRIGSVALGPLAHPVFITFQPAADPNVSATLREPVASLSDQLISFTSLNEAPRPYVDFYAQSHTLFTSLQHIVASSIRLPSPHRGANGVGDVLGPPGAETMSHIRRLVGMYVEEIARLKDSDVDDATKAKCDAIYHIFNLTMILYLPQDGRGEGLLGEELLDWVNEVDPGKSQLERVCDVI